MWACNFDKITNRGSSFNRAPDETDYQVMVPAQQGVFFNLYPERYQYLNQQCVPMDPSVLQAEDIDRNRKIMVRRIREERDSRSSGGIKNSNIWYASDAIARQKYLEWKDTGRDMIAAGSAPNDNLIIDGDTVPLESIDDTQADRTLKISVAYDLVDKAKILDHKLQKQMKVHIAAVLSSIDPLNYDLSTGWPLKF